MEEKLEPPFQYLPLRNRKTALQVFHHYKTDSAQQNPLEMQISYLRIPAIRSKYRAFVVVQRPSLNL